MRSVGQVFSSSIIFFIKDGKFIEDLETNIEKYKDEHASLSKQMKGSTGV